MAENKMKEIAKLLGVELGVPFKIKGVNYNPYKLTEAGLIDCDDDHRNQGLMGLLIGKYEIEQQILTEVEKRYLENVLRPFKDMVMYIKKEENGGKEYIYIPIKNDATMLFPYFDKGSMYKGMQLNKKYTLEELGLFQD